MLAKGVAGACWLVGEEGRECKEAESAGFGENAGDMHLGEGDDLLLRCDFLLSWTSHTSSSRALIGTGLQWQPRLHAQGDKCCDPPSVDGKVLDTWVSIRSTRSEEAVGDRRHFLQPWTAPSASQDG